VSDAPQLVHPEGWVLDWITRDRLARQLRRADPAVDGIVAPATELPAGASFRVHAERCALRPVDALEPLGSATTADATSVRGALLVRPGVRCTVEGDVVAAPGAHLLVDPGTHAHDPWQPPTALVDASPAARPPFPWRPVVAVVVCGPDPDPDRLDWARSMVNALLRRDVEGRLAVTAAPEGLHLTRPCLASPASLEALAPDVVVAADDAAREAAPGWCRRRSTVVVEVADDPLLGVELVSWRLGRAQGRLRARIGERVAPATVADLARRLSAGPQPEPPQPKPALRAVAEP
jgi:hypothetical protein